MRRSIWLVPVFFVLAVVLTLASSWTFARAEIKRSEDDFEETVSIVGRCFVETLSVEQLFYTKYISSKGTAHIIGVHYMADGATPIESLKIKIINKGSSEICEPYLLEPKIQLMAQSPYFCNMTKGGFLEETMRKVLQSGEVLIQIKFKKVEYLSDVTPPIVLDIPEGCLKEWREVFKMK